MTFHDIVVGRSATKNFDGRKVPADQVLALQELVRHAATAFNLQPWRALVVGDDDALKRQLAGAAWDQPQITSCSHLFVFCANTDLDVLAERLATESVQSGMPPESVEEFIDTVREFIVRLGGEGRLERSEEHTSEPQSH